MTDKQITLNVWSAKNSLWRDGYEGASQVKNWVGECFTCRGQRVQTWDEPMHLEKQEGGRCGSSMVSEGEW